jgi:hypothetical protein
MDTGGITPDTIKALKSGYKSPNLLGMIADIGRGGLSNLESLVRGGVAQFGGTPVDTLNTIRTPYPMEVMGDVNYAPDKQVYGGTKDILGMMPKRVTQARPETAGMEELGTVMGPGLAKGVAPAVKGYASLLGNEINAGMTGQPTRSIIGQITPKPLQLDVYHGTPHQFPPTERNPLGEFDASKIGTGEGAQVYGHGLYVAENPAVAKEYQNQLGTQMQYKGKQFYDPIVGRKTSTTGNTEVDDYLLSYLGDAGVIRKELLTAAKEMRLANNPQALKEYQTLMADFRKIRPDITAANTGSLYKADLPDEMIPKMLDYDKTWKEQPKNVQDAIDVSGLLKYYNTDDISTSQVLYHAKQNRNPAQFAEFLRNKGIPGVKYLDEGSRAEGKGTRNFVIFPGEEQNIKILERNAEKTTK